MKRLVTQKRKKNFGESGRIHLSLDHSPWPWNFTRQIKAYNYVRKSFDLGLPHVNVIRSWYSSMNGVSGFTKDAMTALKAKVTAAKRNNQEL
jgi:hypothetical protein